MTRAAKKKSKAALVELLDLYGYDYTIPSPGQYRVKGCVYYYRCKGVFKGGRWHYFDSHFDFVQSL